MTRDQAIYLRTLQLQGKYIAPELLTEAIEVIARTNVPATARQMRKKGSKPSNAGEGVTTAEGSQHG